MYGIKFVDMHKSNEDAIWSINKAIANVLGSGRFIGGEAVEHFETRFSSYIGTKYGVGVGSGSDALKLALLALGIKKGDKVAVPSFTFVSTVDAVLHVGAIPVFVDVNNTYSIDPEKLRQTIAREKTSLSRIKAVIVVHLYGIPADMESIMETADEYGILVIEDAAQAHGAKAGYRRCGSIGHASCFSFYPSKNLGAMGDGGMVCSNDNVVAKNVRELREYGQKTKYIHERLGFNSRLDAIQAAILDAKLDYLDKWNYSRLKLARKYDVLGGWNVTRIAQSRAVYHIYPYHSNDRDRVLNILKTQGIECLIHYPLPVHLQSYYSGFAKYRLPVTEHLAMTELSLPMYQNMSEEIVETVVEAIKRAEK